MPTQRDRILLHLRQGHPLTAWEALREYGVMRLAARIEELRREGYPIETAWVEDENRWGEPVRYAEYRLATDQMQMKL